MKKFLLTSFITMVALTFKANAQNDAVINQYGPPTFTGGTTHTPSESFAIYQETRTKENPVTTIESIYPDPAQNTSSLVLAEMPARPVKLYVINLNGTVVKTYSYDGGNRLLTFDVSDLQNGIYNIQVQEQGKIMQSIKLLKQS